VRHFLLMIIFASFVAIVFGAIGRETTHGRLLYSLKIFSEFVGVGLLIGWILYWIP
jgi:hypothetical protein